MNPQLRRLILAIIAWPAGLLGALVLWFLSGITGKGTECSDSTTCVMELQPVSWTHVGLWFALAFVPGILATRAWWNGRHQTDTEP